MASSADQLERCVLDIGHWMSANRMKLNADKTELPFASSGHCCAALNGSYRMLKLGRQQPRSFARRGHFAGSERRSSRLSCLRGLLCRLRQLRRIRRSLDSDSLAMLIYAVVNSRMDYCNTVLAGAPKTVTDKLQRVLNAAARVITGTRKFDRGLGQILHDYCIGSTFPTGSSSSLQ